MLVRLLEHKVTSVSLLGVTVGDGVAALIKGYRRRAASRGCTQEGEAAFVSLGSQGVAGDQTKAAIDTGTFTLTLPRGGGAGLTWANGNCDLFAGSH